VEGWIGTWWTAAPYLVAMHPATPTRETGDISSLGVKIHEAIADWKKKLRLLSINFDL